MISPHKPIIVAIAIVLRMNAIRSSSSSWNRGGAARFLMPADNVILILTKVHAIHDQIEDSHFVWEFSHYSNIVENSATKKWWIRFLNKIFEPHLRFVYDIIDSGLSTLPSYLRMHFFIAYFGILWLIKARINNKRGLIKFKFEKNTE